MRRSIHFVAALGALALFAFPAAALDCAKPAGEIDSAICADPKLKAAADEMATALGAILPLVGKDQAALLTADQAQWESGNADLCGKDIVGEERRAKCLMARMSERTSYFSASPLSGPGGPDRLLPWTFIQAHTDTQCAGHGALYAFGPSTASPGAKAFNDTLRALIAALAAGDFARDESNDYDNDCSFAFYDAAITYASPDLAAVSMQSFFDDDAKDGHYDQHSVITDLAAGKTLSFADIFPEEAKATMIGDCTKMLREARINGKGRPQAGEEQGIEPEPEPPSTEPISQDWIDEVDRELKEIYAETIKSRVTDLAHWIVYADHAEIYFPEQAIGSNVEGNFSCPFANAQLAAFAGAKGWIVK